LYSAMDYLAGLCLSGRLKARSAEMRILMGEFNHDSPEKSRV